MRESELQAVITFELAQLDDDEVLWRVAQGEVSPNEASLRAPADGQDQAEQLRVARLFAPPSTDASRRLREELLGEQFPTTRPRRSPPAMAFAAVLAAAAAVLLAWFVLRGPEPTIADPMPRYQAQWVGQFTGEMLGDNPPITDDCERYKLDGGLEVHLKPAVPITDELLVVAFANQAEGGREYGEPLTLKSTVGADGVLTIKQNVSDLDLPIGRWTVSFAIARALDAPPLGELRKRPEHPGVTWLHSTLCIER